MKIIYAYDPLCGWCYGVIPVLKHFVKHEPNVTIEVLPGGLFVGSPARPYQSLSNYIRQAEQNLERVTGRKPSEKFHALISRSEPIDAASERPSHAVLQVNSLAPDKALDFAHRIQELHYEDGVDLNLAETYVAVCDELGLPRLDTDAIVNASLSDPIIQQAYSKCAALGTNGYPTLYVEDDNGTVLGRLPHEYEPERFLELFRNARSSLAA